MPANKFTRSENFNVQETNLLLDRIEVHKAAILNRSTRSSANQLKYNAWMQIVKDFKKQGLGPERTVECLRNKWENLKRLSSPHFKNGMAINEIACDTKRSTLTRVMAIQNEADKYQVADPELNGSDDDVSSKEADKKEKALWDDCLSGNEDVQSEESMDGDVVDNSVEAGSARKTARHLPISPKECRILLECIKPEKKFILSQEDSTANFFKHEAWDRVTAAFNKASPVKRSQHNLRTKFENMKRLAKRSSFKDYMKGLRKKHQTLVNENTLPHKIKAEPITKDRDSADFTDDGYNDTTAEIEPIESVEPQAATGLPTLDPLSTVLNGTVGNTWMQSQRTDVVKMQVELLNFQTETAKLERQRVMSKMQADATERQARELETALRLRAARLEVVAAEMKLPSTHPALLYAPDEQRAQQHMNSAECV